ADIAADPGAPAIEQRRDGVAEAAEIRGLDLRVIGRAGGSELLDVLERVAPFIGDDLDVVPLPRERLAQAAEGRDLCRLRGGKDGRLDQKVERRHRFFEAAEIVGDARDIHGEELADRAVDVEMDARAVVLAAELAHPLRKTGAVFEKLAAVAP